MSDPAPQPSAFDAEPLLTLPAAAPPAPTTRWSVLAAWNRARWAAAAAAAGLAAAALVFANGAFAGASLPWAPWTAAVVAAGSAAFGLLVGSLVGAPIGAEATACDVRGPLFGMMGLLLATTQSRSGLIVQLFAGLPLDAIRYAGQPAVASAAVVLMVAALSGRLRLERDALADPAAAEACATCMPLFPHRPHQ